MAVIHSGGRKLNAKVIVSCAVWAEEKAASSKTERQEVAVGGGSGTWQQDTRGLAVQSSRQDLKRKVWLFEWFD